MRNTKSIKQEAKDLGFELVGVTSPDQPLHYPVFKQWIEQGRHAGMTYLESSHSLACRENLHHILPGCKSVLVFGIPYPQEVSTPQEMQGQIAAYACVPDYHLLIEERLARLVSLVEDIFGQPIAYRFYTDTGPILERDLAQRAGLGWIGKNTCLINPQFGSYFFLAEILIDVEIDYDQPFTADRCGSCTRCLQVCPTSCILPDRTINARRCISYLTIENKGAIPRDLRPLLGNWIFGCDVCQQVCPWNKHAADQTANTFLGIEPSPTLPDLLAELQLTPEQFQQKYNNSAIKRSKRRGYLRNVCVATANQAALHTLWIPQVVQALIEVLLKEAEPLVRGHAAWGLGRLGTTHAYSALLQAKKKETDPYVFEEIAYFL